jgi:hypothetical protein
MDEIEDNENNKLRNLVQRRRSILNTYFDGGEIGLKPTNQYKFKMNREEYIFYVHRDCLEYYKISDRENKMLVEYTQFRDYITHSLNSDTFQGIIQLRFIEKGKKELEMITYDEEYYKQFINAISEHINGI